MPKPVKFFTSLMQGAPQLSNAWGVLTDMLDACLVNGFNLKTIDTLTRSAGVATATISAGHLYQVNQVLLVAGAAQAEYNGEVTVLAVTATTLTYQITGTPVTPATGTITAKVAPLGWEIAFTGTNKRAYRSTNVQSNRPYLRVDNSLDPLYTTTYAKKGKVTMAESMTGIDTFTANTGRAPYDPALPTKNEVATGAGVSVVDGWHKWYYAKAYAGGVDSGAPSASNRNWVLVGDDRGFYLFTDWYPGEIIYNSRAAYCFTDFASFRSGDGYNTLLSATDGYVAANIGANQLTGDCGFNQTNNFLGRVLMRDHIQIGATVRAGFVSLNTNNGNCISGYSTGVPWPNGPDYSLILHPVYLRQENSHIRGKMPGMFWVHNDQPLLDLDIINGVTGYADRKFLMVGCGFSTQSGNVARLAFDITGPWW